MLRVNKTGYEEADLIADAINRISLWAKEGTPRHEAVSFVFGIPEQASRELCLMHDVDPDSTGELQ